MNMYLKFAWPRRGAVALLLLALCLPCSACSGKGKHLYPVHGQVFFEGKPIRGALVIFHPMDDPDPNAPKPRAVVGRDGSFNVFTYAANDGAPAGNYAVSVYWDQRPQNWETRTIDLRKMEEWKAKAPEWRTKAQDWKTRGAPRAPRGAPQTRPDPVPTRYRNPQTSGLLVEVQPEANELAPFNLAK